MSVPQALGLAVGLHKEGRLDDAEAIYGHVLGVEPDNPNALHFLGLLNHQRGRSDEGLALIRRALERQPDYEDARNNLGSVLQQRGRLAEAVEVYRALLAARPDHVGALGNLRVALKKLDRLEEALEVARRLASLRPDDADVQRQLGTLLIKTQRHDEAVGVLRRSLTLRPDGEVFRRLAATLYALGRVDEATGVYREWLGHEPDSPIARHLMAACTGDGVPARAEDSFVTKTFDVFADSFDEVLGRLGYRAPGLCAEALARALGPPRGDREILDAGCGTGLCGPLLRPHARRLTGVDLSGRMLEKCAARAVYDDLARAELGAYLDGAPGRFDVVVSADTLVYFGALGPVLAAAARALRPGGLVVFTVEHLAEDAAGVRLNPHGRYSHGRDHVTGALAGAGLQVVAIEAAVLRREGRQEVAGLVVSARRP